MSTYDPTANAAHSPQLQDLLKYASDHRYVCPLPSEWDRLHNMLPPDGTHRAPLPLILGAWNLTENLDKWLRFEEHLVWADTHGALAKADRFLRALTPEQWLMWDVQ
jgi:hypothetical protein